MYSEEKSPQSKATTDNVSTSPWWKKLGWMAIIWFGSVLALFAFSSVFKLMMTAAGMKVK
ncbi:TPA: DUF2474 domain-containing protein [Providencia rettgeri]|uniref:DUF2474 domain-containing protein n=1 Tax=Providencia rettgeri TaxID=587 RepID=A0A3R8WCE6_PRORE|nr:DUF2474 domain-containing protein [Providencia rettgeri]ELR5072471.1 DUF2474 domain-containing protein [Providencia stuartii]ELR5216378.1 DUF2474 domain-containing protein [Providencia rettgeri]ELR5223967.1 DUF2474 domain-containing protein [Providencia rettgeri]ELR5224580.1 DUF2474 domain-containing protein [Providencia rettgeri]